LGVKGRTPWYLVREELQRDKLNIKAERKTWENERKLRMGIGNEIARKCWEDLRGRSWRGRASLGWERKRREYFERRGVE